MLQAQNWAGLQHTAELAFCHTGLGKLKMENAGGKKVYAHTQRAGLQELLPAF